MLDIYLIMFLIIRIFINPFADILQKKITKEISPLSVIFYSYLLLSISYLPFLNKYITTDILTVQFISLVILAGFICICGTVCIIHAVNISKLPISGSITSYKSIAGLIIALIFLKEIPSIQAVIGILLIITGSKLIFNNNKEEGFSLTLFKRKDVQLKLLAVLLTGTEAVVLKKIILISSIDACFICWCFMGMMWSFIFLLISKQKLAIDYKNSMMQLMIIALCIGFMQCSTNYVFSRMNVGYALALFQLSAIVTAFGGCKLADAKEFKLKIIGSLIMFAGSVFILLF